MRRRTPASFALALLLIAGTVMIGGYGTVAQEAATPTPVTAESNVVRPEQQEFSEDLLNQLQVPEGFEISVFARDLANPRMMAVGPDGTVYVTRRDLGDVLMLRDADGDGSAEEIMPVASALPLVHGITIQDNQIFLATDVAVYVADLEADGTLSEPQVLVEGLPGGGQHPNRTIAFGPDGMLYITVGSTCNACNEPDPESATIVRAAVDGSERTTYAEGLRNTIGFFWHPETGELWGFDHGSDGRGDDQPPEELNRIEEGGDYGWPYCFADQQPDQLSASEPPGTTLAEYCAETVGPVLTYQAHSAPIAMIYYTADQFPEDYQGDAYVAMRGSWNRSPATGYKVVRVDFENGQPVGFEDFVAGWLLDEGGAHFGRIAGLAVAADGSLLIAEDTNGVIYRVTYTGEEAAATPTG